VQPYVKNVQICRCPSSGYTGYSPSAAGSGDIGPYIQIPASDYGYSGWMSNRAIALVDRPAELLLVMDSANWYLDGCQNAYRLCFRHSEQGNFAFGDGHVKSRKSRSLRPDEWWTGLTSFYGNAAGCTTASQWSDYAVTACLP
jgi:prepilin-type processing-associated H-X9-DG protein